MPNSDTVSLRPGDMIITFGQCMCLVLFRFLRIQKDWQFFLMPRYTPSLKQVPVVRPIGSIIRVFMITLVRSPHEGLLRRGSIFPVVSRATIDKQTVHQFRSSR